MILAQSDTHAWMPLGAALAHEDVAGNNVLMSELRIQAELAAKAGQFAD